jgi:hypothetical protein
MPYGAHILDKGRPLVLRSFRKESTKLEKKGAEKIALSGYAGFYTPVSILKFPWG